MEGEKGEVGVKPKFSIRNLLQLPTASNTSISEQFLTSKQFTIPSPKN